MFFAPGLSLGNLRITLRYKAKQVDASGENPMKFFEDFVENNSKIPSQDWAQNCSYRKLFYQRLLWVM